MANKDAPRLLKPLLAIEDIIGMGATGGSGVASDVLGFGADLFGFDDLAGSLYDVADEQYKRSGQFYEDFQNTYTGDEYPILIGQNPGIDTDRFNELSVLPKTPLGTVLPKTPLETVLPSVFTSTQRMLGQPDAVTTVDDSYLSTPIPADLEPNIGFMGEGDIASDEINALIEAAKGARSGPKDRGALGRQHRDEKAAAQARADQAIDKKMNADAASKAEKMFMAGMEDFLSGIRGAGPNVPKARSLEDYKKEFADATGLDISGDVDKSQALMAFGLALMQNKAKGKGIGGMLDALGAAGTAAMPALSEARKEARANAAAAGKYALEMRSADQAKREAAAEKSLQRQAFYVLPRGKSTAEHVANIVEGVGRREYLNAYELNAAVTSSDFSNKYDIIPASQYDAVVAEAMKAPEAQDRFLEGTTTINLFGGGDKGIQGFEIEVHRVNPNVENAPAFGKLAAGSKSADAIYTKLGRNLEALNREEENFAQIIAALESGEGTTPKMIADWFTGQANKLGFKVEGNTATDQINFFLQRLKTENAQDILGEAGKTISDADRRLVSDLVGQMAAIGGDNPDKLVAKLKELHKKVIQKNRVAYMDAFRTLDGYSRQDNSALYEDGEWSPDDEDRLKELRSAQGAGGA